MFVALGDLDGDRRLDVVAVTSISNSVAVLLNTSAGSVEDQDGDGVLDATDNCPAVANADQADADRDAIGTACDAVELPKTKAECRAGGWKAFRDGSDRFKSQGDCVSFVATAGRNAPGA